VAGVHGLEHVEGLCAAAFADDDSLGAHAECVADEVGGADGAFSFDVGWSRFQADDVVLLQLQLGGVFDGPMRSVLGMKLERVLSKVVLPEPVPPEMRMFSRALMAPSRSMTISGVKLL